MGKTYTQIINDFSRGMTNDVRTDDTRYSQLIKNFDAHSYSRKLVPLLTSVDGDTSSAANKIQNFVVAKYAANDYRNFGLGLTGTKAKVFVTELNSSTWAASTKGAASSHASVDPELFVYYANAGASGRIYGAADGTTIWCCDPTGTEDFDETDGSDIFAHTLATAYANPRSAAAANRPYISGMVHSADNSLYIAYDNIIIRYNAITAAWNDPALTLPTNIIITAICEYGNYLAIGVKSKDEVGSSQVYLWDRDSTVNDLSEKIDWGEGNLQVLKEIGGVLVGVSSSGTNATVNLSRMTFRYYAGGKPVVFNQLVSEETYSQNDLKRISRKINDYLYFFMKIKLGDTTHEGIWKIGKHIQTGAMVLSLSYPVNNGTALTGTNELHSFIINGDTVNISYTDNNALEMDRVAGGGTTYSANSTYETTMLGGKDISITKKLEAVTVTTDPLTSSDSITIKYKKDKETAWTTIFTNTVTAATAITIGVEYTILDVGTTDFVTDFGASANTVGVQFVASSAGVGGSGTGTVAKDVIRHSAINIESSGATLPTFNEIQFQIISTGGAIVTGLKFKYSEVADDIYG